MSKLKDDEVDLEKLQKYILELNKANEAQKETIHDTPCPSCGRCPTCGRGGYVQQPYITWTANSLQAPNGCGFCGTSACMCHTL